MTLTFDDIIGLLAVRGAMPPNIHPKHKNFVTVSREWILGQFSDDYLASLRSMGIENYQDEKWNCVCFSELARIIAAIDHARTPGHEGTFPAIGTFDYMRPEGPHEVDAWITGPEPEDVLIWEPQLIQEVKLDFGGFRTCFDVSF